MIDENNKLIADFMGIDTFHHEVFGWYSNEEEHQSEEGKSTPLAYNWSWDWLMPVVEKIESINETDTSYGNLVDITTTYVRITRKKENTIYGEPTIVIDRKTVAVSKIDAVYKAVIEFIKWYNEQNRKK